MWYSGSEEARQTKTTIPDDGRRKSQRGVMSERTRTEARQGRREGDMPSTSTSVYDPRKGSEPKQKDDGRHGGQGSVRSRMITKLEATLKRGPRVSGRARKVMMEEAAVEERY